ncbi:DUF3108 domain-containing protein [Enterovirga aerilata]|uniref:DUF3108 domain-containing protein n=1 Tax=Enterovirga aerilata TaxID=2730920 RepID=A0A849I2U1_9HYPH|nr:DUF3108 domain-containing protein [Enterovirga sp. DB1703]NNM71671.1 DUF3108 domain-containing protein [Enterovirga sp. DB1703]
MQVRLSLLGAALLAACAAPPVAAADLRVDYRITLAGLTLGKAELRAKIEGERYDLSMNAQLTGLAGLFTASGRGGAMATGALSGNRALPSGFSATGRSGGSERTVQIALAAGNATEVRIEPPFEPRPDRVPLEESHRKGIVDPLSAVLAVAPTKGRPDDPALCNRTLPVFDGTQRFNVVLSYAGTQRVHKPGFSGDVLVCNARYVPLAGHRPQRWAVKYMQDNREMAVWLASVEGTRVLVPLRVNLMTYFGMSIVEAERWALE